MVPLLVVTAMFAMAPLAVTIPELVKVDPPLIVRVLLLTVRDPELIMAALLFKPLLTVVLPELLNNTFPPLLLNAPVTESVPSLMNEPPLLTCPLTVIVDEG